MKSRLGGIWWWPIGWINGLSGAVLVLEGSLNTLGYVLYTASSLALVAGLSYYLWRWMKHKRFMPLTADERLFLRRNEAALAGFNPPPTSPPPIGTYHREP